MTRADREALREVAEPLKRLFDEVLQDAPVLEVEEITNGVHTDAMVSNKACILAGFMKCANLALHKLRLPKSKKPMPRMRPLARTEAEIPVQQ